MMTSSRWRATVSRRADLLLSIFAIAAILLLLKVWRTEVRTRHNRALAVRAAERQVAGSAIDAVGIIDTAGIFRVMKVADGRARVLIVLSTTCTACKRSRAEWEQLSKEKGLGTTDILAVADEPTDEVSRFLRTPDILALRVPADELYRSFRSRYIPMTIVVAGDGRVAHVRVGVLTESHRQRVGDVLDSLGRGAARRL